MERYMDTNSKKNITLLLVLCIGVFIIYSINIHIEYRHFIKESKHRNYQFLSFISVTGNNLANKLTVFIELPIEQEENSEVKRELYDNWRVVNGESKNIDSYLYRISNWHMGNEAADWSLFQHSLFRVDSFIDQMTDKFLEHHSYAISSEENEKLEAVIAIYRTIHEEVENESVDLQSILQSIKEPMIVLDDYYQMTLEQLGR